MFRRRINSFSDTPRRAMLQPAIYANCYTEAPYHPRHLVYWRWVRLGQRSPTTLPQPWRKLMCCSSQTRRARRSRIFSFPPKQETNHECKEEEVCRFRRRAAGKRGATTRDRAQETKKTSVVLEAQTSSSRGVFDNRDTWARRKESIWPRSFDWRHAGENWIPESQVQDKTSSHWKVEASGSGCSPRESRSHCWSRMETLSSKLMEPTTYPSTGQVPMPPYMQKPYWW